MSCCGDRGPLACSSESAGGGPITGEAVTSLILRMLFTYPLHTLFIARPYTRAELTWTFTCPGLPA